MKSHPLAGIDLIPLNHFLHKGKLGLLTNGAALTRSGIPSRVALMEMGFTISRLFSPEHGLGANEPDGEAVGDQIDLLTGLPVISMYGERLKPSVSMLHGLDAVVFDIPDVGCRFYTYLWSMTYMMEACEEVGIPFVVLDRPNPIGGDLSKAEGPILDELTCSSFMGRWSIPIRHCCSFGELARFFQATRFHNLQLEIISCTGWERNHSFFETGVLFTPTSPAIRDAETALFYPGTGLLEGINVNEGRGTTYAFKQTGAPWINATKWKQALESSLVKGVRVEIVDFVPEWGLYAGEVCNGIRFAVTDASQFRPVAFGVQIIQQLMKLHPQQVLPRLYKTVANPSGENHLDRLLGIKDAFGQLQSGAELETDVRREWAESIKDFLLY